MAETTEYRRNSSRRLWKWQTRACKENKTTRLL